MIAEAIAAGMIAVAPVPMTGHGAMIANDHNGTVRYHNATCQYDNPRTRVLCIQRAPADICKAALNMPGPCWWFVGSDTMIVFNWKGQVSVS